MTELDIRFEITYLYTFIILFLGSTRKQYLFLKICGRFRVRALRTFFHKVVFLLCVPPLNSCWTLYFSQYSVILYIVVVYV